MTTGDRLVGRGLALMGLAFGVAYLGWRIVATLGGAPPWLAASTLIVEIVGFVAVVALVWGVWPSPQVPRDRNPSRAEVLDIDVLVRCSGQDTDSLRATLLAARHLGALHVLDLGARPEIAALALEVGAVYVATDSADLDGLGQALPVLAAPAVLLLEAGDVPRPDIVDRLAPWLDRPDVAVVQGAVVSAQPDSAEHAVGGRNDKDFERRSLLPSLGARGMAAFTGSGALMRRLALREVPIGNSTRPLVAAEITAGLLAAGWRIEAPGGDPVVAVSSLMRADVVESMHACEASGALHLLAGPNGALRINALTVRHRLALLAIATRPLAGIRRSVVIGVLLASLLSGSLPFRPSVLGLAALWAPWFVLTSVGLWVLSAGSLRPGDRLRASMRLLGASWRGVLTPNGRPERAQYGVAGAFGLHHGVASAVAVAAISVVVGLRGISDRLTHTLQPLPLNQTAGLLAVALWSLGGGLDALRLLARRAQTRRATRVASSLPSTFADRAALVVDLTPRGAGVISEVDLPIGTADELEVVVPTASGCLTARVPITVKNVRADFSGERRYGVEFGDVHSYVADALAEFCLVQPALEVLGGATIERGPAEIRPVVVLDDRALLPRRIGLRLAALVAVAGALASSTPAADASSAIVHRLAGRVVAAEASGADAEGALVTVVCSIDAGRDGLWGTSDDHYTGPVSTVVDDDGRYQIEPAGEACWLSLAPPAGFAVPGGKSKLESAGSPQVLDLSSAVIATIEILATGVPGASVGTRIVDGVVWADADADDTNDGGELLVPGVAVSLLTADGTVQATRTTSPDGAYSFAAVPDGTYRIGLANLPNGLVTSGVLGVTGLFVVDDDHSAGPAIGLRSSRPPVAELGDTGSAAPVGATNATAEQRRLLPAPDVDQLAAIIDQPSPAVALVVVVLATLMGLSVAAGSIRPGRQLTRRLQTSR